MKNLALLFFAATVSAQTPTPVEHAAVVVAALHDAMLDPASFVLDGAFVTKPDKHGKVSYCYAYRSHNTMGGYAEGRAAEDAANGGKLSTYTEHEGHFLGYDTGWIAPCKAKNLDRDITTEVMAFAPSLYKKDR